MSETKCSRCDNLGMAHHRAIAGGICFACGRLPGGSKASTAFVATARQRVIGRLKGMIAAAKDGRLDVRGEDKAEVLAVINSAPADVAARARAAFGLAA